jgi:hypothetical protein
LYKGGKGKEYPKKGLRVRREDKGARFIIEDSDTEDERITENLSNPVYYRESANDPIAEYMEEIKQWADTALEKGELDDKQHKFVTNIDDKHLAVPKPL